MSDIYFAVRPRERLSREARAREKEIRESDAIARRRERRRAARTMHPPLKQFERRRTQPRLVYAK